ncbi:MAG: YegS/Rv2252/BmrU family lipid kinase [Bacilli bacterium]|nr:YegS/Rv2252/BmrU family lipid kinase [Bacilli bacterium]
MIKTMMIYNPLSGKQDFIRHLDRTVDKFTKAGYDVVAFATKRPKQATELARQACEENYEMLIIVGGDGTFNECVNGLMDFEKRPRIGYIPAGTCCDIGMTLGLTKNVRRATDIILSHDTVKMDVVKSNDRYFCYVSGNGAFIDISYVTDSRLKKKVGYFAYLIKGIEELFTIPKMKMQVNHDNGEVKGRFSLILIINSKRVAGINMIYKPSLDDGLVDVVMYRSLFPLNGLIYLLSLLLPFWSTPIVNRFKTSQLKVITDTKSRWNVDGESGGLGNQNVSVCRHAIEIVVPPKTRKLYFRHQNEN